MICVFDIESIPDIHLLASSFGYSGTPLEIANAAFEAQKQKSGSSFLPLSFHRIISIASVLCDDDGNFIKVGHFGKSVLEKMADSSSFESTFALDSSINDKSAESSAPYFSKAFLDTLESNLLGEFWQYFNKNNPKIISFNGRSYDMPLLCLRAMKYNLSAFAFFETDNIGANKSKWDNYRARYSESFHIDLLDSLGHYGIRSLNLNALCQMLDLVGKYDMSGEEVHTTYFSADSTPSALKALETINHYCHSDVLNTYWLYLKYELLKGNLLLSDYANALCVLRERMPKDKPYSEVFGDALGVHIERLKAESS